MKTCRLPTTAWLAIGFAVLLSIAIASVHFFQVPANLFMSAGWWWFDITGLALSTVIWFARANRRAPDPVLA